MKNAISAGPSQAGPQVGDPKSERMGQTLKINVRVLDGHSHTRETSRAWSGIEAGDAGASHVWVCLGFRV